MNRRSILKLAGASALSVALPAVHVKAQGFPSGPITLVVAWPAGGGSDDFHKQIMSEYRNWAEIAREANIKAE